MLEKKAEKMDVFAPVAKKLIDVGGGNKSALTCSGSADSAGAVQLANLTMKLEECAMKINASCNMDDFPKPDPTTLEACTASVLAFETKAQECLECSLTMAINPARCPKELICTYWLNWRE